MSFINLTSSRSLEKLSHFFFSFLFKHLRLSISVLHATSAHNVIFLLALRFYEFCLIHDLLRWIATRQSNSKLGKRNGSTHKKACTKGRNHFFWSTRLQKKGFWDIPPHMFQKVSDIHEIWKKLDFYFIGFTVCNRYINSHWQTHIHNFCSKITCKAISFITTYIIHIYHTHIIS